jgi:Domain of Unknown Function (DUF1259)
MEKKLIISALSLVVAAILFASIINSPRLVFASSSNKQQKCDDAAKKVSKDAEGNASDDVCQIDVSRDSPKITLLGKTINELVPNDFLYKPVTASSHSQVLMLVEYTLLKSEVKPVQKSLLRDGWEVTAIHNHWLFENPDLYFLHAQKKDNLDNLLKDVKDALDEE